jgi:hypothetical protein
MDQVVVVAAALRMDLTAPERLGGVAKVQG